MYFPKFFSRRVLAISGLAGLIASSAAADVPAVNPSSVLIDFDYDAQGSPLTGADFFLSAGTKPLTTLYAPLGVVFSGPQPGQGGVIVDDLEGGFVVPTHSGKNFLAFNGDFYAKGPETITFTSPVSSVTINAISPGTSFFTMTAYNSLGLPIGSASAFAPENVLDSFIFNYYPLTVTTGAARPIDHVILTQQSIAPPENLVYEYDDLRFTPLALPMPNAVVSGRVAFEGVPDVSAISSAAPLGNLTITLRTPGTKAAHYVYSAPVTPEAPGGKFGDFALNVPYGTYDVTIKSDKSLRSLIAHVVVGGAAPLPDTLLLAGDANNDNSVDSSDFTALIGSFNSAANVPGSGYDPTADFNYDGSVDSSDFTLLIGEFNNTGAN